MSENIALQKKVFKEDGGDRWIKTHTISKKDYNYLIKVAKKEYRELAIIRKEVKKIYKELKTNNLRSKSFIEIKQLNIQLIQLEGACDAISGLMMKFLDIIKMKWENTKYTDYNYLYQLIKEKEKCEKQDFYLSFYNNINIEEELDEKSTLDKLEELKNTIEAIESNVDVLIDKVDVLEGGDVIEDHEEY